MDIGSQRKIYRTSEFYDKYFKKSLTPFSTEEENLVQRLKCKNEAHVTLLVFDEEIIVYVLNSTDANSYSEIEWWN